MKNFPNLAPETKAVVMIMNKAKYFSMMSI